MLFYLLVQEILPRTQLTALNVFRYITFRTAAASLSALAISLTLGPWMIRKLREFQIGQVIRTEGPQTHRPKAGTPTMGGTADSHGGAGADAALGRPDQRLRVDRRAHDRRLRRDRIRRRLHEDCRPLASRTEPARQNRLPGRRSRPSSASRC
jgi:hypothetical protein